MKSSSMQRRLSGARAKANGDAFEQWLVPCIFTPLQLTDDLLVRWDKLSPEMVAVPGGKRRQFSPVAESGGDWVLMLNGGRYCAAEAKSCSAERFAKNTIPAHQQKHLDIAHAHGALAFLLLRFNWPGAAPSYFVPWAQVPWQVLKTAQSVHFSDLHPWRVGNHVDAARIIRACANVQSCAQPL